MLIYHNLFILVVVVEPSWTGFAILTQDAGWLFYHLMGVQNRRDRNSFSQTRPIVHLFETSSLSWKWLKCHCTSESGNATREVLNTTVK